MTYVITLGEYSQGWRYLWGDLYLSSTLFFWSESLALSIGVCGIPALDCSDGEKYLRRGCPPFLKEDTVNCIFCMNYKCICMETIPGQDLLFYTLKPFTWMALWGWKKPQHPCYFSNNFANWVINYDYWIGSIFNCVKFG